MSKLAEKTAKAFHMLDSHEQIPPRVYIGKESYHFSHANLFINISGRLVNDLKLTKILIYDKRTFVRGFCRASKPAPNGRRFIGYPAWLHQARASAIANELNTRVIDHWLGEDRQTGITIVLEREAPRLIQKFCKII